MNGVTLFCFKNKPAIQVEVNMKNANFKINKYFYL